MKLWLMLVAMVTVLAGCSGGGSTCSSGCTNAGGGSSGTPTVKVALSSPTVTSAQPATVTATVHDADNNAVSGLVVSFAVKDATIGKLSQTAALTDNSGVATVTLSPATSSSASADTVSATATVAGTDYTGSAGYQTSATNAAFTSFTTNTGTAATDRLTPYGQALLTINMSGVSVSAPVSLSLTSACVTQGKASISPSTVTNTSGTVSFTYKDIGGCGSTLDSDTVTASVAGASTSDTVQVFLKSPTANSVTFDSSSPPTIYLKGSGNVESSTVKFKVVDTAGNALPGQHVTLNLSTFAGGLTLDQGNVAIVQTSDSNGFVSAIVNSGTVPTPVRVIATLDSGVSTVSSDLAVVTGLPSELNFSLSQTTINIEGMEYDRTPNTYIVTAADRSGNPVPDNTSILFWTEAGQIQGAPVTSTVNGTSIAQAQFVSSLPRPDDGRVTVVAYAIGEESFVDTGSDNVWTPGMPNATQNFQDLGDIVKSKEFDGIYHAGIDEYISLSGAGAAASSACVDNGSHYAQLTVDKSIVNRPNSCDQTWTGRTYVRRAVETVFSYSSANPYWANGTGLPTTCTSTQIYAAPPTISSTVTLYPVVSNPTWYTIGRAAGIVSMYPADVNTLRLNPLPAGTKVVASSLTDGMDVAVVGGATVGSTGDVTRTPVVLSYKFTTASAGAATVTFTTPNGVSTAFGFNINSAVIGSTCQ